MLYLAVNVFIIVDLVLIYNVRNVRWAISYLCHIYMMPDTIESGFKYNINVGPKVKPAQKSLSIIGMVVWYEYSLLIMNACM